MQDAEDGKQILRDLKGIKIGNLHVGVTYSMGPVLVSALEPFTKVYPNIRLRITFGTSEELLHLLENNGLDILLSFQPEGICDGFERVPLFQSRLYFIVHESHPLSTLSSITLKRLSETPLILPERGFATRKKIEELCLKHQLTFTVGMEINDVHTILHILKGGYWATVLTQAAVSNEAGLVQIPILCADRLTSQGYLFWPQGTYRKKAAVAFAAFLLEAGRK